jgi:hypothetical protein
MCENLNPFDKLIDSNQLLIHGIDAFEALLPCLILVLNNAFTWIHGGLDNLKEIFNQAYTCADNNIISKRFSLIWFVNARKNHYILTKFNNFNL